MLFACIPEKQFEKTLASEGMQLGLGPMIEMRPPPPNVDTTTNVPG